MKVEIKTDDDRTLYYGGWEGPLPRVGDELRMFGDDFGPSSYTGDEDATVFEVTRIWWDAHVPAHGVKDPIVPQIVIWVDLAGDEVVDRVFYPRCTCGPLQQKPSGSFPRYCDDCGRRIAPRRTR